ncbi:helix-turn-helix domain-containing protein [Streptomyces sp. NRRL F-5123]|uniref:helix-turn-helix domain-containing protein n=1 Tax=Streptomyces sp. NRRL F-5123 TaxID=1463856 RepID=UPI000693CCD4|nr:helix-turn-helix transcriptional regulator [Streptomyces sp. NRRL F-5123]
MSQETDRDNDSDRPLTPAEFLGREIRRRREAQGLSQPQLGDMIVMSWQMIAHFEKGRRKPRLDDARRLDQALGTDGWFYRLRKNMEDPRVADHFETVREAEQFATVIQIHGAALIPGLFQTEEYATAVLRLGMVNPVASKVKERVAARLERARLLDDPEGPDVWLLLDEHALRRPVGGPAGMARQLRHVASLARRGRIRFHIIPFSVGVHALVESMLMLLSFADAPTLAYVEGLQMGKVMDDPALVTGCRRSWDLALGDALSAEQSLAMLEEVAEDYERQAAESERPPVA